jgi:hypothetical protein
MRGLNRSTLELINYAYRLLEAEHPMTLRQLHYRIFSKREIDYQNDAPSYRRLSRATTMARRQYRQQELTGANIDTSRMIPPDWIVDETRQPHHVSAWEDLGDYLDAVRRCYRRDLWTDQLNYCEVWSEKGTVLGSIQPITNKWGVTTRVCHGFGSCGQESEIGQFFEDIEKPITVFFLGDHDPSGRVIEEDIHRRAEQASGVEFQMRRLAIHPSDIEKFNLPPQAIKSTDTRAAGFRIRYGYNAPTVELDALPVAELRRRIDEAIHYLIDDDTWNRQVQVQEVELASISEIVARAKNLPRAEARP